MNFVPGQRWHSLTEPELGLGIVLALEGRQVVVAFPARDVVRRYAADPPLARARLSPGQQARAADGRAFRIEAVEERDGLLFYLDGTRDLCETELDAGLDVSTPENRLRSQQLDDHRLFDLRHRALGIRHRMLASPVRGLVGGRIRLFDHQLAVADAVCNRHRIRALLADEVGLGKTVEALLVLHRLLLGGRIENALVLAPPALVHQWLAEAYLRFNLVFSVMGDDTHGGGTIDPNSADLSEQLQGAQLFICPLDAATGPAFTETPWDLVIVDEAHHLEPEGEAFRLVERLAAQNRHLVLLSATPDRHGQEAHFRRLALLDPARFHDYGAYNDEAAHYRRLAQTAESLRGDAPLDEPDLELLRQRLPDAEVQATPPIVQRRRLLARLLDLHGLGRVMFRNVRARIPGFPRRVLRAVELDGDPAAGRREFLADLGRGNAPTPDNADPRLAWLVDFLQSHPDEKVLVLCADRVKVEATARALDGAGHKTACFHEGMGNIARDRQAAWFLDAEGPQAVVSSAVGAEGRNFQVARHLVLLDLPLGADRLEQAIGRLDRIGQGEEILIHPVAIAASPYARLRRWYDEALRVFERPWHGAPAIEREFGEALEAALTADSEEELEELIARGRARNEEIITELESGRDRLLELASFDTAEARRLQEEIGAADGDAALESFMLEAFERGALDIERLGSRSYALRPSLEYHRPFPGFSGEEMGVTFDRGTALAHPERAFLSWDHPMVRDTVDSLLEHGTGNASLALLPDGPPGIRLEALYVVESTLPQHLRADRFLPPTPIRLAVDAAGDEVACDGDALQAADPALLDNPQMTELLGGLLEQTRSAADGQAQQVAQDALQRMRAVLGPAVQRLVELARVNPAVGREEIAAAEEELAALEEGLGTVRLRLDGLRLVLVGAG